MIAIDAETVKLLEEAIKNVSLDTDLRIEISHTGRLHFYVRFENAESGAGTGYASESTLIESLRVALDSHNRYLDTLG